MKDRRDLRMSLGMTQLDMAMLLGISRAQWSMYESGRRRLPPAALPVLAVITRQINESAEQDANQKQAMREAWLKHDEKRLREVDNKLKVAQRDFDAEFKNQSKKDKRIRVQKVVEELGRKVGNRPVFFINNTEDQTEVKSAERLVKLQHRIDTLRLEQKLLMERIGHRRG